MSWKLFLDDERNPSEPGWTVARSSTMGVVKVIEKARLPKEMSLDHDLGGEDNTMRFLRELHHIWETRGADPDLIPEYRVHSANPVGARNIISFMESWKRSADME